MVAAAGFFRILAGDGRDLWLFLSALQKNFRKNENFICTFSKIGYNKME